MLPSASVNGAYRMRRRSSTRVLSDAWYRTPSQFTRNYGWSVVNQFDPEFWGIVGATGTLEGGGLRIANDGCLSPPEFASEIIELVPEIGDLRSAASAGNRAYWDSRPPVRLPTKPWDRWWNGTREVFESLWSPELDELVDSTIDQFRSTWLMHVETRLPTEHPVFFSQINTEALWPANPYAEVHSPIEPPLPYRITWEGFFEQTLKRRTWNFPTEAACVVCGCRHYMDASHRNFRTALGGPGLCGPCGRSALWGDAVPVDVDRSLRGIRSFVEVAGHIPPSGFRSSFALGGLDSARQGLILAAATAVGDVSQLRAAMGGIPWIAVLQRAGVVGETWRPSRGTMCLADCGHQCRSLGEKSVCDWLRRHSIDHSTEPRYPQHPEYNPTGSLRADWLVGDHFIEFAGMLQNPDYAAKMATKRTLADALGIRLTVLTPEDLPRLVQRLCFLLPPPDAQSPH